MNPHIFTWIKFIIKLYWEANDANVVKGLFEWGKKEHFCNETYEKEIICKKRIEQVANDWQEYILNDGSDSRNKENMFLLPENMHKSLFLLELAIHTKQYIVGSHVAPKSVWLQPTRFISGHRRQFADLIRLYTNLPIPLSRSMRPSKGLLELLFR